MWSAVTMGDEDQPQWDNANDADVDGGSSSSDEDDVATQLSKSGKQGAGGRQRRRNNRGWAEKYRPRSIDDVVSQTHVTNMLRCVVVTGDLPHMMLYGRPGTGKTSTILAVCRQLFGPDLTDERVLELNASDENGIKVIREKVGDFARKMVSHYKPKDYPYPVPAFSVVILDEADAMTEVAQGALRQTMETYSASMRFCICCNYASRIIDPIQSRCALFAFKPIMEADGCQRLAFICQQEGVDASDDTLAFLLRHCHGDMRRAINTLQTCKMLWANETIDADHIAKTLDLIPHEEVVALVDTALATPTHAVGVAPALRRFLRHGYLSSQLVERVRSALLAHRSINDIERALFLWKLSAVECALAKGGDEYIHWSSLFSYMAYTHHRFE